MRKTKRQIEDEKDYGGRSLFDLIELEFSQGEENEQQNGKSSQHREITNNAKRTSISSNTPSVDRQENSAIQLDNTREMGGALSQHNQESGNVGFNDISIATNTNGTSNLREQRSGREENTRFNRYGDTSRSTNQSQSVLEYKGLIISGERTDLNTLSFYVLTSDGKTIIEPENMIYKRDDKTFFKLENYVNFGGFIKRLNHFYNDLEKFTQFNKTKIENLEKEILELKSITGDNTPKYKRKDYLEALREDNRIVMEEIEKMSKQKNYKSAFVPKSARILEELDKQNKIVKENMIDFK